MKLTRIILAAAVVAAAAFLTACTQRDAQADAEAAVARGEYRFIALLDVDGKWTHPHVPEIPDWYFQTAGIQIRETKPETRTADLAYMRGYNDSLYRTLKAHGKFHVIEENVARVKARLDQTKQ